MKTKQHRCTFGILGMFLVLSLLTQGCFFFKKEPEIEPPETGVGEVQQPEGGLPAAEGTEAEVPSTELEDVEMKGDTTASLDVTSTPSGATVFLDGEPVGTTPLEHVVDLGDLPRKTVEVGVAFQGSQPSLSDVTLERGKGRGLHIVQAIPEISDEVFDEFKELLWDISNPKADFTVALQAERTDYEVEESITFDIDISADAHIVMLNWDTSGGPALLFPNDYLRDTLWRVGKHPFPSPDADFEIQLQGPPGTERFKVLAFQNEADANAVINLLQPEEASGDQGGQVGSMREILESLLDMNPAGWAAAQLEIPVREPERPVPDEELLDVSTENIVYIKHGNDMYLARVLETTRYGEVGTTAVHIFNEALREELYDTINAELVLDRRTEPAQGWGNRRVMLSFYRDGVWTFTTDVVIHATHYELPARIDGKRVQGSRIVSFGEVRFPIPVSFR